MYRSLLHYFSRISQLDARTRALVIVGGYVLVRLMTTLVNVNPRLAWVQLPVYVLYGLFACCVWISDVVFKLLLRFDPVERSSLSAQEVRITNVVGGLLVLVLLLLLVGVMLGSSTLLLGALVVAMLLLPITATLRCTPGRQRTLLAACTSALALLGLFVLLVNLSGSSLTAGIATFFILGCVGFHWLENKAEGTRF